MKLASSLLVVIMIATLGYCLAFGEDKPAPPAADAKPPVEHASLAAYPTSLVTLKDPADGMLFYVESNGRRVVAFDKEGAMKWNVDVLTTAKPPKFVGANVIRQLTLKDNKLWVTFGKHSWASVDPATGQSRFEGSD